MKRIYLAYAAIVMTVLGVTLFGALYFYVSQETLPPGTVVAGFELGRRQREEAILLLDREIAALNHKQAVFTVAGNAKILTWEEAGVTFEAAAFREEVRRLTDGTLWGRALARRHFADRWTLTVSFDPRKLQAVFSPEWEKTQFGEPVNAVRTITTNDEIRYVPGTPVQRIDWEELAGAVPKRLSDQLNQVEQHQTEKRVRMPLSNGLAPQIIPIPLKTIQPEVTIDTLKSEGIRRKIVQFSTSLWTSGSGRVHNVDSAARSIDGIVLAPGETFDYGEAIEYAEKTFGFRQAPVIFGGKLVPGVGGGICQVSSTLYNAAVRAGLTIVERRNHSLPVSYLPKGQDATFAKGYINFRFKNTSGHHLLIRAQVENSRLTVKLFGDMPENVSYSLESRTTKLIPAPNKYVVNAALPAGSQQVIVRGKQGYVVETYRIKQVDGRTVERTRISEDTYPAQPNVIAVHEAKDRASSGDGGAPDRTSPKPILEDGVTGPDFR